MPTTLRRPLGFVGTHVPAGHASPLTAYIVLAVAFVLVVGGFALRAWRDRRR